MQAKTILYGISGICFISMVGLTPWRFDLSPKNIMYTVFYFPIIGGSFITIGLLSGFIGFLL